MTTPTKTTNERALSPMYHPMHEGLFISYSQLKLVHLRKVHILNLIWFSEIQNDSRWAYVISRQDICTFSDKELKKIRPIADKVLGLDITMSALTDEQLKGKTVEFKVRLAKGGVSWWYFTRSLCCLPRGRLVCTWHEAIPSTGHRWYCTTQFPTIRYECSSWWASSQKIDQQTCLHT